MKTLTWWLFNIAFTALMVAGWCYDIEGARNLISAVVMAFVVMSWLQLSDISIAERIKQGPKKRTVGNHVLVVLRLVFFAWFGAFWLCSGLMLIWLMDQVAERMAFPGEAK